MITIAEAAAEEARHICAEEGVHWDADRHLLVLRNGEERDGYALYARQGREAELLCVQADASVLTDGLIRAALHAAEEQGCVEAFCRNTALFSALDALDFVKCDKGRWVLIREFFNRPCRHP